MCVESKTPEFTETFQLIRDCTASIQAGRATARTYRARSSAFQMIQALEPALEDCTIAINFNPPLPEGMLAEAYNQRCVIYRRLNRIPEATADGEKAVSLAPDKYPYLTNLGLVYFVAGDMQTALSYLEKVVAADRNDLEALLWRARTHKALGNSREAVSDISTIFEISPYQKTATLFLMRAEELLRLGDYHEAAHDCSQGLEPDRKQRDLEVWKLLVTRGWALYHMGDLENALGDFMDCLLHNENALYAYLGQALVFRSLGAESAATADIERFVDLHPKGTMVALQEVARYLQQPQPV